MKKSYYEMSIKSIVELINKREIVDHADVPLIYHRNQEVINAERKARLRVLSTRGYDVLTKRFFVNELVDRSLDENEIDQYHLTTYFGTFEEYFAFVEGDIYDNACYYQYQFTKNQMEKYSINLDRLNTRCLVDDTVDDCVPEEFDSWEEDYETVENRKQDIKKWISQYNGCESYKDLVKVNELHKKSLDGVDEAFYLWNYYKAHGENAFNIFMDLVNAGLPPAYEIRDALPFIFDKGRVLSSFNYSVGAQSTIAKHKRKFKAYIQRIEEEGCVKKTSKYFCMDTHFYCICTNYYFKGETKGVFPCASVYDYFGDFSSFSRAINNDLSDCNLLYAKEARIDSSHIINENTKLPIYDISVFDKTVEKRYDRHRNQFVVTVKWLNKLGKTVFVKERLFKYFFDFLGYLKNDLSSADLLHCDGLENLSRPTEIIFDGALLTSDILDALGIPYEKLKTISNPPMVSDLVLNNEKSTALALNDNHSELSVSQDIPSAFSSDNKVYYISDIHLLHKIIFSGAKTREDIVYLTQRIIDGIFKNFDAFWMNKTILIGGDVSSEFDLFVLFVKLLRRTIDELSYDVNVIFVLGNHEFWNQEGKSVGDIVKMYRSILQDYHMYLLYDELLYLENKGDVSFISKDELLNLDKDILRSRVRKARLILFGGVGFAGCNENFNADNGIYRGTISRRQELALSEGFANLYSQVKTLFGDKKIIVFTHMNICEWSHELALHDNWIYVSGHSHLNTYYDDGSTRLYADNQIGYHNTLVRLKSFLIDNSYDWFSEFDDGIYDISRNDYVEFYRGKNIPITFNREFERLYMLKRNCYYTFIMENKSGKLTMLNGGALKGLSCNDIDYFYQNMEAQIGYIKSPLLKYQEFQRKISEEIRKIGGTGRIHGAIIDIDGNDDTCGWSSIAFNHLYVNPVDMSITPYYASDMVLKYVYPSFSALLCDKCPQLFDNYNKLIASEEKSAIILKPIKKEDLNVAPILYTDTNIYKASRELRKMQKLNSNILSTWLTDIPNIPDPPRKLNELPHKPVLLGTKKKMACGMEAEIIEYKGYRDITIRFDDGSTVEHVSKASFDKGKVWNPNIEKKKSKNNFPTNKKSSYVGRTQMMNCGIPATVIDDFGCNDITIQFADGLVRKHKRRDKFREGKIAHCKDEDDKVVN